MVAMREAVAQPSQNTAPEMQLAALRAMIEAELIAALPMQLDAKLASEAQMMLGEMVDEILAQCARDPANSHSIAQTAVSAAAPRLRSSFSSTRENATYARHEAVKKKRENKAKTSVKRERIEVRQPTRTASDAPMAPLSDSEYAQINRQADMLFEDTAAASEQMRFEHLNGVAYWHVELGEGRYALVPAEDIQMISIRFDPARGYLVEQFSKPVALGGSIQSNLRQMHFTPQAMAATVGTFADTDSLAERLRRDQEQMQRLITAWQLEQERRFGEIYDAQQCASHGLLVEDMWELPNSFAPEETPELDEKHLAMVH